MKLFAMESMIRQYKIDGLPYDVDLCFTVHELICVLLFKTKTDGKSWFYFC